MEFHANQRLRGSPETVTLIANDVATNPEARTPASHRTGTVDTSQHRAISSPSRRSLDTSLRKAEARVQATDQ